MFRGVISQTNKSILIRSFCTGGPAKSTAAPTGNVLRLGDVCPDFTQDTQSGKVNFYKHSGDNWSILFSHPADYTPVCTTELGRVAKLLPEFEKRKCKVLALSVDSAKDHSNWISDINETQKCDVTYPIIADQDRKVANLYGMVHPNTDSTFTVRSVYFIAPDKKLRAQITLPPSTGRNFDEILRILDSLQLADKFKIATPVDWVDGQDVIIPPTVSDEAAKQMFPKGFKKIKPYLRTTPQPNK
ncbi:hypothetical protein DICPUDRAFT_79639 [Dictyostelium purpureum]|uniref:Thioredoxin domain-containing protein n=1 Tax=Dictyostelium purpureum TaxID=5786 RepID=F0ZN68_DICPU|nr:uncharacterized protein DICPUDRAFT_79639 [Dictyostelium purpureum]EGC34629.1 hypothetical protein DICPUDRAFT_79639 [Dictyostelium purpureum]|eukprot:XP_003288854.1 hypothetical protein DICPUDRAFT_79639 [Dictyostelium purpureum]